MIADFDDVVTCMYCIIDDIWFRWVMLSCVGMRWWSVRSDGNLRSMGIRAWWRVPTMPSRAAGAAALAP